MKTTKTKSAGASFEKEAALAAHDHSPASKPENPKTNYGVPALDKGLDVLEMLATHNIGATPSEIAKHLNRSLQEVYRVVMALERRGYIQRHNGDGKLFLSFRMHELANLYPPLHRLVDLASPILKQASSEIDQALHLAVLDHTKIRIVAQCDSPAPLGFRLRVGTTNPAQGTASGRTLMAFQRPPTQEWMLEEIGKSHPQLDIAVLRARLKRVRQQGYEVANGEILQSITDVSFPILDSGEWAVAVLTMPFLEVTQDSVPFDKATRLLFAAASKISEKVGHRLAEPRFPLNVD